MGRILLLVELKGGNDGLNTVVPTDGRYHDLRPRLALRGLHALQQALGAAGRRAAAAQDLDDLEQPGRLAHGGILDLN